jgi:excisionase family DNA binding protein
MKPLPAPPLTVRPTSDYLGVADPIVSRLLLSGVLRTARWWAQRPLINYNEKQRRVSEGRFLAKTVATRPRAPPKNADVFDIPPNHRATGPAAFSASSKTTLVFECNDVRRKSPPQPATIPEPYYTVREVAEIYRVKPRTVRNWIKGEELRAWRRDRLIRIPKRVRSATLTTNGNSSRWEKRSID